MDGLASHHIKRPLASSLRSQAQHLTGYVSIRLKLLQKSLAPCMNSHLLRQYRFDTGYLLWLKEFVRN